MSEQKTPEAFEDLGLSTPLLRALQAAGYHKPTPIQQRAIGPALAGRDLIGCAQTGTGKTAAFCLPLLQRLAARRPPSRRIRALVVTPTRELAVQIGTSLDQYGTHLRELHHTVIFGGVGEAPQIRTLRRGVDIVVATPGRLLDLVGRRLLSLDDVEYLVLDEADRMLDMGFLPDVRRIVARLPTQRQTLFFSATMPSEIRSLSQTMLRDPVAVSVTPVSSVAERIEQRLLFVDKANKRELLAAVLAGKIGTKPERTLVFSRTKHGANKITKFLEARGIKAAAIHGNKSQAARTRALDGFRAHTTPVLVATDIAARGIDVDDVTHVVNFDLPEVPETYVHRIGRTGRASASGTAVSFCDAEERDNLVGIERLLGKHIERIEAPDLGAAEIPPPTRLTPASNPGRPSRSRRPGAGGTGGRGRRGNRRSRAAAPAR